MTRAAQLSAVVVVVYLLAPLLVIFPVSVTDQSVLSLPRAALSLQHYRRLFDSEAWQNAALQSLFIGTASATIATVFAFLAACAVWLNRGRLAQAVAGLMIVPMVVPTIVTALGLYRVFVVMRLIDTYIGVILAHTVIVLPYAFILCLAGLSSLRPTLFHTARSMGAPPLKALLLIVLPLVRGAVAGGWIIAFLHSWDELLIMLFLSSRTVTTLPRLMWEGMNDDLDPIIAAVSVLLLVVSSVLLWSTTLAAGAADARTRT